MYMVDILGHSIEMYFRYDTINVSVHEYNSDEFVLAETVGE